MPSIEKVEIVRETEKQVVINMFGVERRESKTSDHSCYFDTFAQAREYLLGIVNFELDNTRAKVDSLMAKRNKIIEMSERI